MVLQKKKKQKKPDSCEIQDFVETRLCKLRAMLRSREVLYSSSIEFSFDTTICRSPYILGFLHELPHVHSSRGWFYFSVGFGPS